MSSPRVGNPRVVQLPIQITCPTCPICLQLGLALRLSDLASALICTNYLSRHVSGRPINIYKCLKPWFVAGTRYQYAVPEFITQFQIWEIITRCSAAITQHKTSPIFTYIYVCSSVSQLTFSRLPMVFHSQIICKKCLVHVNHSLYISYLQNYILKLVRVPA